MSTSSTGSSTRAGQRKVTKHHVCGTNGIGDPRILVGDVEPGSVIRYGIDDDMTCLVLANFQSEIYVGTNDGDLVAKVVPTLLLYGCMGEETDSYEVGRLMTCTFGELDTISILSEPGV